MYINYLVVLLPGIIFRNNNPALTYKLTLGSRSFVVKFAPPGYHAYGSWYDVSVPYYAILIYRLIIYNIGGLLCILYIKHCI